VRIKRDERAKLEKGVHSERRDRANVLYVLLLGPINKSTVHAHSPWATKRVAELHPST
jgi:hypothetical protein